MFISLISAASYTCNTGIWPQCRKFTHHSFWLSLVYISTPVSNSPYITAVDRLVWVQSHASLDQIVIWKVETQLRQCYPLIIHFIYSAMCTLFW